MLVVVEAEVHVLAWYGCLRRLLGRLVGFEWTSGALAVEVSLWTVEFLLEMAIDCIDAIIFFCVLSI